MLIDFDAYVGLLSSMPQKQPLLTNDLLRAEFGRLILKLSHILELSPNCKTNLEMCKQLCACLKASDSTKASLFTPEKLAEINHCEDFRRFFEIVHQHLSWDELYILTQIIDECDSDEAEEEFSKYERKIAISQALEIINSVESKPPPGFEKFCVIIDKPHRKLAVEKYEETKTFIFESLDTHCYVTNKYIRVLFDPLHIEWHVTVQATPHMTKMAFKQQAYFKSNFFVFMKIGKEIIIDDQSMHTDLISVS